MGLIGSFLQRPRLLKLFFVSLLIIFLASCEQMANQYAFQQGSFEVKVANQLFLDFQKLAKELGVDEIEVGNIQLNPNTVADEWLPENKDYVYDTYMGETRNTPCHWPWSGLVINSDGGVTSCTIVDDPTSDFGNVFETSIMEVVAIKISNLK